YKRSYYKRSYYKRGNTEKPLSFLRFVEVRRDDFNHPCLFKHPRKFNWHQICIRVLSGALGLGRACGVALSYHLRLSQSTYI
ncbi:MAG: hypothetical protein SNJ81_18810, partial [Cyanobacteriota bacterium]